ncbi:uncharacterized protein LOC110718985 [Chenopodium quinoa]|uniref:uncharacterized protein LOC110718985 n=1 Tax=Chenopodium quinoa TaxID=63459 RepID=UPI000B794414|nr:uncharacterized protein LOC110718985 [Chenopodium quinoa]
MEYVQRIRRVEVEIALKKMKPKKVVGPDGIPIELRRCLGKIVTRPIQDEVPWCMLFANDIVLVDETKYGVNAKLEQWRQSLESREFKLSRSKTGYLKNGDIDQDVALWINSGCLKWRAATGVLCHRSIPLQLKGKFYRTAIRPVLLYGTECWVSKKEHIKKMEVTEMRMLRWICGSTLRDRIRNEVIRKKVGVVGIADKLRKNRLRWFGHRILKQKLQVFLYDISDEVSRSESTDILIGRKNKNLESVTRV